MTLLRVRLIILVCQVLTCPSQGCLWCDCLHRPPPQHAWAMSPALSSFLLAFPVLLQTYVVTQQGGKSLPEKALVAEPSCYWDKNSSHTVSHICWVDDANRACWHVTSSLLQHEASDVAGAPTHSALPHASCQPKLNSAVGRTVKSV